MPATCAGLTLNNVRFEVAEPDLRPAMVFDHVTDAAINGLSAPGNPDAKSLVRLIDSRDILFTASRVLTPTAAFLDVRGAGSRGIKVDGGDLSKAAEPVRIGDGAGKDAVTLRP